MVRLRLRPEAEKQGGGGGELDSRAEGGVGGVMQRRSTAALPVGGLSLMVVAAPRVRGGAC
jgi:hypothetical protein